MTRTLARCTLATVFAATLFAAKIQADPIRVRQTQGTMHGFLVIRSEGGEVIGHGDLIQTAHGTRVTTELALHFKDGSVDDETAVFTQNGIFHLISDHHIQKGPFFKTALDMTVEANGQVTIRTAGKDGKVQSQTKHVDLPADVSNGILAPLMVNIPANTPGMKLGFVAPQGDKPRLIKLNVVPDSTEKFTLVGETLTATVFRIHLELGGVAGVVAPIIGKQPGDLYIWISESPAPQLLRLTGALADGGQVVSIELPGATFPHDDATGH
jgi:hypothetical protein